VWTKCQEFWRVKEWIKMCGGCFIWSVRDGRTDRRRSCNKNHPLYIATWGFKGAGADYLRHCNVWRRKLTHNKTKRRPDKYKWPGKVRKRERSWRRVSCLSHVFLTTVYPPMRMRFYQHNKDKRMGEKRRDKTAATIWCDVMWCVVMCCDMLWCAVMFCDVLCCDVLCCVVMWCVAMCCAVMWCGVMCCDAMCCDVLWCVVMCCDVLWCDVMWCVVLWCDVFRVWWIIEYPELCASKNTINILTINKFINKSYIQVSHELRSLIRESVPYVKIYRYNPKHLRPKLNGYGDNGQRKVGASCGSTYCTC
jgi:hypothetical protein